MNVHHLLTFSIRAFQLQVSAVDRAVFNFNSRYGTLSLLDEKDVHLMEQCPINN